MKTTLSLSLLKFVVIFIRDRLSSIHSGIDPAGEEFMDSDSKYLDVTDGSFVDVIRTGTYLVPGMGHVEFLPNGGYDFPQPGCVNTTIG